MSLSLAQTTALCRLLADPSRLRLLLVLQEQQLSVAELTQVTRLAQSRVSTHLARLQRAGLVETRRLGSSALYGAAALGKDQAAAALWALLREGLDDAQARLDRERAAEVVRARQRTQTWAESVAGRMERHYSPGRTWEATARALIGLLDLGDVADVASGDGVLAELLADRARSITCIDVSATVIAAARQRLQAYPHVRFLEADMHALPLEAGRFDHVFLMHALAYTRKPQQAIAEAARVLKPGGRLVLAALHAHRHKAAMESYDHQNQGFAADAIRRLLEQSKLKVETCRVTSREDRPPYFEVITAQARR
ncbi:MAG TPA: metalloregulator ArsR/SmtB family transcription factor [Candidatus Binatia bacterium]|nr:metalloregulator ArsR/SmtB family transcription factor [Candidatus Binatia bacterium]